MTSSVFLLKQIPLRVDLEHMLILHSSINVVFVYLSIHLHQILRVKKQVKTTKLSYSMLQLFRLFLNLHLHCIQYFL